MRTIIALLFFLVCAPAFSAFAQDKPKADLFKFQDVPTDWCAACKCCTGGVADLNVAREKLPAEELAKTFTATPKAIETGRSGSTLGPCRVCGGCCTDTQQLDWGKFKSSDDIANRVMNSQQWDVRPNIGK